jgi:hypothetical protein
LKELQKKDEDEDEDEKKKDDDESKDDRDITKVIDGRYFPFCDNTIQEEENLYFY